MESSLLVWLILVSKFELVISLQPQETQVEADEIEKMNLEKDTKAHEFAEDNLRQQNGDSQSLPVPDKFISPQGMLDAVKEGLEVMKKVADVMSGGLAPSFTDPEDYIKKRRGPEPGPDPNPFKLFDTITGFFKLVGVDKAKLNLMAVNSLIVLIHLVINNLLGGENSKGHKKVPEGNLYSWISKDSPPRFKELIKEMMDNGLEEKVMALVREKSPVQTDCVQLLLCRTAPVLWGLQKALAQPPPSTWSRLSPSDRMYVFFPSLEELAKRRPSCEIRFPNCRIKYTHLYRDLEQRLDS